MGWVAREQPPREVGVSWSGLLFGRDVPAAMRVELMEVMYGLNSSLLRRG